MKEECGRRKEKRGMWKEERGKTIKILNDWEI